jgi:hypothetical protein
MSQLPRNAPPAVRPAPLTADDLIAGLVWPKLFRAAGVALAPGRIILGLFTLIAGGIAWSLAVALQNTAPGVTPLPEIFSGAFDAVVQSVYKDGHWVLDPALTAPALYRLVVRAPYWALSQHTLGTAVALILTVPAVLIGFTSISRSAALQFAYNTDTPWPEALGFGISRARTAFLAVVAPMAGLWGIALLMGFAGAVLLNLPLLNVVGSLFYAFALAAGLAGMVLIIAVVFGTPLILPAIAADNSDGFDAVQRAYAYVFGRTGRTVLYTGSIMLQGAITYWLMLLLLLGAMHFAQASLGAWVGTEGRISILGLTSQEVRATPELVAALEGKEAPTGAYTASSIVRLAKTGLMLIAYAYLVSFVATGATVLYLALRRINDGQDMHEVWMPPGEAAPGRSVV